MNAMSSVGSIERYRFGSFELQPDKRRLLKDNATLSLRQRAFNLLVALVDRAWRLISPPRVRLRNAGPGFATARTG